MGKYLRWIGEIVSQRTHNPLVVWAEQTSTTIWRRQPAGSWEALLMLSYLVKKGIRVGYELRHHKTHKPLMN